MNKIKNHFIKKIQHFFHHFIYESLRYSLLIGYVTSGFNDELIRNYEGKFSYHFSISKSDRFSMC